MTDGPRRICGNCCVRRCALHHCPGLRRVMEWLDVEFPALPPIFAGAPGRETSQRRDSRSTSDAILATLYPLARFAVLRHTRDATTASGLRASQRIRRSAPNWPASTTLTFLLRAGSAFIGLRSNCRWHILVRIARVPDGQRPRLSNAALRTISCSACALRNRRGEPSSIPSRRCPAFSVTAARRKCAYLFVDSRDQIYSMPLPIIGSGWLMFA